MDLLRGLGFGTLERAGLWMSVSIGRAGRGCALSAGRCVACLGLASGVWLLGLFWGVGRAEARALGDAGLFGSFA